jgi:hypothetical protein
VRKRSQIDEIELGPGDQRGPEIAEGLQELRRVMRDKTKLAVTVGMGPRYLHSTGQLHKGGPDGGRFVVVVGDDPEDADIPGTPHSFSRLKRAQAAGDLEALRAAGRPARHLAPAAVAELA